MKSLLITLDFINDIVHPDGKIAHSAERISQTQTIKKTNQLIAWARTQNIRIAHVRVAFREDYSDCPAQSPLFSAAEKYEALQDNHWGTEFHSDLAVQATDAIITKKRVSAFYNTDLEVLLRSNQIEQLIICGVSTNMAVELTAREAHDRDYRVLIASDACQTASDQQQQATFDVLQRIATIHTVAGITGDA